MPKRALVTPSSPATLRDVAQAAGVHISTVSRALDPRKCSLLSDKVVQSVKRVAGRLGYLPNRAASALRTGRSNTIGVLVPDITNPVFPPILKGIEGLAAARGYFVLVANVGNSELAQPVVERILSHGVDGIVLATAVRGDPLVDFVLSAGLPAVMVNRADDSGRLPSVVSDDRLAMRLAVAHLKDGGRKRIAHLAGPQHLPTGADRLAGFDAALRELQIKGAGTVTCQAYTRDAGRKAMAKLLAASPKLDAVVCCNDLVALGAYDALAAAALHIPRDVAVTGHNDMPLVDMVCPALTTIRLPHHELGWRAASILFEVLDELHNEGRRVLPSTVVLRPELVVRASTSPISQFVA